MIAPAFAGTPAVSRATTCSTTSRCIGSRRRPSRRRGFIGTLGFFNIVGIQIPVGVSSFPHEIYAAPKSWAEKANPKLVYYKKHDVGGHFAAWEQPQLFCEDVRATFRSVRSAAG